MLNMKKGFTLAEVLIVIAIIGVVAALTVPNIMENYKRKVYVSQLQRSYNVVSNAMAQLLVDQDVDTLADTYLVEVGGPERFMRDFLKTTKICNHGSNLSNCVADIYTTRSGAKDWTVGQMYSSDVTACAILETGATFCVNPFDTNNNTAFAMIDVNGLEEPNVSGRDFFPVYVHHNGSLGDIRPNATCSGYGAGCFGRIQNDGWKMDY